MYEKLAECLAQGKFIEAMFELQEEYLYIDQRSASEAAQLCVLEATIWEALADSSAELDAISKGLSYDPENYELYYMLGLFYRNININRAYLCLEMALHYCKNDDDKVELLIKAVDNLMTEINLPKSIREFGVK